LAGAGNTTSSSQTRLILKRKWKWGKWLRKPLFCNKMNLR